MKHAYEMLESKYLEPSEDCDDSESLCLRCEDLAKINEDYCQDCLDVMWNRRTRLQTKETY